MIEIGPNQMWVTPLAPTIGATMSNANQMEAEHGNYIGVMGNVGAIGDLGIAGVRRDVGHCDAMAHFKVAAKPIGRPLVR